MDKGSRFGRPITVSLKHGGVILLAQRATLRTPSPEFSKKTFSNTWRLEHFIYALLSQFFQIQEIDSTRLC